jgi:formylglycine-generating enzyme required for sulfatase activity
MPIETLAKAIAQYTGAATAWEEWHLKLRGPKAINEIAELARKLRIGDGSAATLLLPIDQFEEVFTIADASERVAFLTLLAAALDPERGLPLRVVATGRADVLHGILEGSIIAAFTEGVPLSPIPLDRVPRLVEGPAAIAGLAVEKGLAEKIMHDVESPDALPLLAYTLALLYARCADSKRLTLAAYAALGDAALTLNPVQNSVRLAADQAVAGCMPNQEELAALRDAFVPHLVRLRLDDAKRVRQPARFGDLPREAERLLRALIEARLLSTRSGDQSKREGSADAVIEVAHEALFDAWPTLNKWLYDEQNFLADMARLKAAHESWQKASESEKPQALLRGLLLDRGRDWLARHPRRFFGSSMQPLRTFIVESAATDRAEKARTRQLRSKARLMAALLGMLIVGMGAGLALANREYLGTQVVMLVELMWPKVLSLESERRLRPGERFKECADCPDMIVVNGASFIMGSPDTEGGYPNERPQHDVGISSAFAVARFEVTFEEFDACALSGGCTAKPWDQEWGRGRRPVIYVSWNDAQQYVSWLVRRTGKPYRLLSEAEWEFAARAKSTRAYSWGDEIPEGAANCNGCGSRWDFRQTAPVDWFSANPFGLHDMHGNVWEWVQDCYENYSGKSRNGLAREIEHCGRRVVRGGAWISRSEDLRSARRLDVPPSTKTNYIGFRVGRSLAP